MIVCQTHGICKDTSSVGFVMQMSIAKKANRIVSKKPLPSAKPAIAAFNMNESDDEAE